MKKSVREALIKKAREEIRAAFFRAVREGRQDVNYKALEDAFKAGNVTEALAALNLSRSTFAEYGDAVDEAIIRAGQAEAAVLNSSGLKKPDGMSARVAFDYRDPAVERLLRDTSGQKIVDILDDQLAGIRGVLEQGMVAGNGPRAVATRIAGQINPLTGKREGGLIGLTKSQMENVTRALTELTSRDPDLLKNYLNRAMRDKRYDGYVKKAIDGEPIPADIIRKMDNAYMNRALQIRAETIARTEAMQTLHIGQHAAYQQAIDQNLVQPDEIVRVWESSGDGRTRESHDEMHGQEVPWGEPFTTPSGVQLMFPGDPSGPAEEIINCRCNESIRINYLKRIGR